MPNLERLRKRITPFEQDTYHVDASERYGRKHVNQRRRVDQSGRTMFLVFSGRVLPGNSANGRQRIRYWTNLVRCTGFGESWMGDEIVFGETTQSRLEQLVRAQTFPNRLSRSAFGSGWFLAVDHKFKQCRPEMPRVLKALNRQARAFAEPPLICPDSKQCQCVSEGWYRVNIVVSR